MATPTVSVVMPVFNGEHFLREAVESILGQTFTDFEFIVINDGSTDGTAAMLDSYARSDPRISIYPQENRGLVESLNRGCGLAQGKYLAIMHADDVAIRDRLLWQAGFMENHAEVAVVGGAAEIIGSAGNVLDCLRHPVDDEQIKSVLFKLCPLVHAAAMIRRDVFQSVGGYRRFFPAEDWDLWLRIAERWRLANLAEVVVKYRIHPHQATSQKRRQETLCGLAARAFALARRQGKSEPVVSIETITPQDLLRLGVDQATQDRALAGDLVFWIGWMSRASQDDTIVRMAGDLIDLSKSRWIVRSSISNAMLMVAHAHYRQGRPLRALGFLGRAFIIRPAVAGRPVKRLVNTIFGKPQTAAF